MLHNFQVVNFSENKIVLSHLDQIKNLQVIVKFISKTRIVSDCWVDDPMLGKVSQEIAILTRVQHHNIVKVTALLLQSS